MTRLLPGKDALAGGLFPQRKMAQAMAQVQGHLAAQGVAAYLVGGILRDLLLGRPFPGRDIDLAVAGDGLAVARGLAQLLGGKLVPLDEGIARVVLGRGPGAWHLDVSGLRGSIEQDLSRRDFTLNALALELGEALSLRSRRGLAGHIDLIDPLGGRRDLEARRVRAVAEAAFLEDPARLLRAVRLASQFHLHLEEATTAMVRRHAGLIAGVAGERVREELNVIMANPGAGPALLCLDSLGLLPALMPELAAARGVSQPKEHHWDVLRHSLEAVRAAEALLRPSPEGLGQPGAEMEAAALAPWSPELEGHFSQEVASGVRRGTLLKWAALLHDTGKPATRTVEAGGRIRFLGHSQEGAALARAILERLRFSSREIKLVTAMVEHHLRPAQLVRLGLPSRRAAYRYFRDTAEAGLDTLFLFLADYLATSGPALNLDIWRQDMAVVEGLVAGYFQGREAIAPPKLVDGHDIIKSFQLSPGPLIGRLLEAVREAQAAGEVARREEALALVARLLEEGGASG